MEFLIVSSNKNKEICRLMRELRREMRDVDVGILTITLVLDVLLSPMLNSCSGILIDAVDLSSFG